jgi:small conductance mechanosensitive channel
MKNTYSKIITSFRYCSINKLIVTALLITVSLFSYASDERHESVYTAVSASNLGLDTEDLKLILLPLTRSELQVEALAWQEQLQLKAKQLSQGELAARKLSDKADNAADKKQDDKSEKIEEVKDDLLVDLAGLRLEQSAVIKRLNLVLSELEKKGGDITELKAYASALSGVKVSVGGSKSVLLAIKAWLFSEEGGMVILLNLFKFIIVMCFVILIAKLAGRIVDRLTARDSVSSLLEKFISMAVRRVILVIGFIASISILGINVGPVLALIGAAGLVIGLALQSTLSNFASGMLILLYRPYDIGDLIEIDGNTGFVDSMTLLSTTIRTFDNQHVVIPNNSVWGGAIVNITGSKTRRVDLVFGIGYGDEFEKAKQIINKILDDHSNILEKPKPIVRVNELGDSSVNIICRPWVKTKDYWDVRWDIIEAVKHEFDAQGITIPFPQRDVHLFPAGET